MKRDRIDDVCYCRAQIKIQITYQVGISRTYAYICMKKKINTDVIFRLIHTLHTCMQMYHGWMRDIGWINCLYQTKENVWRSIWKFSFEKEEKKKSRVEKTKDVETYRNRKLLCIIEVKRLKLDKLIMQGNFLIPEYATSFRFVPSFWKLAFGHDPFFSLTNTKHYTRTADLFGWYNYLIFSEVHLSFMQAFGMA